MAALIASYAFRRRTIRALGVLVLATAVLALPPLWLRSSRAESTELDRTLTTGQPAMLELYSDL